MPIDAHLSIECTQGSAPGTTIFTLSGPLTLRNMFDLQTRLRAGELPSVTILDLTAVPYMDSAGMGLVINHYVHCTGKGARFIAAGVSPRVHELFRMTKVDSIIPQASTVAEAQA